VNLGGENHDESLEELVTNSEDQESNSSPQVNYTDISLGYQNNL
jgi:hypothetical protein